MTEFYVGQRVRVIKVENPIFQWLIGMEGTISGPPEPIREDEQWIGYPVAVDGTEIGPKGSTMLIAKDVGGGICGYVFWPIADNLEPLTKLDNTATTWDSMPCDKNGKFREVTA